MKLPRNYQPHVMVFSMASYFYFLYYFIFFNLYTLLGLCGQLNKANKTLVLALLKVWNAISSALLKDLLIWVLMESFQWLPISTFYTIFIFFYLYTLLGLCGQLNKANKTLLLALLKIWNAISSSLHKDLLSWVLMESLQRHGF